MRKLNVQIWDMGTKITGDMQSHGPLNCNALLPLGVLKLATRAGELEAAADDSDARAWVWL